MYNSIPEVVLKLKTETGLNCLYELLAKPQDKPCITYMQLSNVDDKTSEEFGYSNITYRIKIWADDMSVIMSKALLVDSAMRELGFKRINSNELIADSQICEILDYKALAKEDY